MRPADAAAPESWPSSMPTMRSGQISMQHVEVGGDDVADRQVALEHLMPAVPEDADEAERREQVDQRDEVRAQPSLVHRAVVDVVGFRREPSLLQALGAEALDDAHAGDALLDDARQVGELLLELQRHGEHAARESRRRRC